MKSKLKTHLYEFNTFISKKPICHFVRIDHMYTYGFRSTKLKDTEKISAHHRKFTKFIK